MAQVRRSKVVQPPNVITEAFGYTFTDCDFPECNGRAIGRCTYDLNMHDNFLHFLPGYLRFYTFRGVRGCNREYCRVHAGELVLKHVENFRVFTCEDCQELVRQLKIRFVAFLLFFLAIVAVIVGIFICYKYVNAGAFQDSVATYTVVDVFSDPEYFVPPPTLGPQTLDSNN